MHCMGRSYLFVSGSDSGQSRGAGSGSDPRKTTRMRIRPKFFLYFFQYESQYTVCPGSSDPFYVVTYYIKWVTTSWTYSNWYFSDPTVKKNKIRILHLKASRILIRNPANYTDTAAVPTPPRKFTSTECP